MDEEWRKLMDQENERCSDQSGFCEAKAPIGGWEFDREQKEGDDKRRSVKEEKVENDKEEEGCNNAKCAMFWARELKEERADPEADQGRNERKKQRSDNRHC
jgi:hypothetical protein